MSLLSRITMFSVDGLSVRVVLHFFFVCLRSILDLKVNALRKPSTRIPPDGELILSGDANFDAFVLQSLFLSLSARRPWAA